MLMEIDESKIDEIYQLSNRLRTLLLLLEEEIETIDEENEEML
jgi:hypothetical protein